MEYRESYSPDELWRNITKRYDTCGWFVETASFTECKKIVYNRNKLVICGPIGSGKTRCAIEICNELSRKDTNKLYLTSPEKSLQLPELSDYDVVVLDNITETHEWESLFDNIVNYNDGYIHVVATAESASSLGKFQSEFKAVQLQYTMNEKDDLWNVYNESEPFININSSTLGYPIFCSLYKKWKVPYTFQRNSQWEMDADAYFENVVNEIKASDPKTLFQICSIALELGDRDTSKLNYRPKCRSRIERNFHCLCNAWRKEFSKAGVVLSDNILENVLLFSLEDESHLKCHALNLLMSEKPGVLLDIINTETLVQLSTIQQQTALRRSGPVFQVPEEYFLALLFRISNTLTDIDRSVILKSHLFKDMQFLFKIFVFICDDRKFLNVKYRIESLELVASLILTAQSGSELFVDYLQKGDTDEEKLAFKSTLKFLCESKQKHRELEDFWTSLENQKAWSTIQKELLPTENWDSKEKVFYVYKSEMFPRYDYHLSLIKKLTEKILGCGLPNDLEVELQKAMDNVSSHPLIMVRGNVVRDCLKYISSSVPVSETVLESGKYEEVIQQNSPMCAVCFLNNKIDLSAEKNTSKLDKFLTGIKPAQKDKEMHILLVEDDVHISENVFVAPYSSVVVHKSRLDMDEVHEWVTSILEEHLSQHLEVIRSYTETRLQDKHRRHIEVQIKALEKRLSVGYTRKTKAAKSKNRVIAPQIQDLLSRYSGKIYSYGFWLDEFRIHIEKDYKAEAGELEKEIQQIKKLREEFPWPIKVILIVNVDLVPHEDFARQGDKCYFPTLQIERNGLNDRDFGTVGGFVYQRREGDSVLVIISCEHMYRENQAVYVKHNGYLKRIGRCTKTLQEAERDLSILTLNNRLTEDNFDTVLRNNDEIRCNAALYQSNPNDLIYATVHKKGARTGWTDGTIISVLSTNLDNQTHYRFLIQSNSDASFSEPGDSASYVIQRGNDSRQSTLEAVGVVCGKHELKPYGENVVYYDQEESDLIVCEDFKSAFSYLEQMDGVQFSFTNDGQS